MAIFDVFQKTSNDRRRDHVGDSLRDVAAVTLERDAHHLGVLHDWSSAVARIDLRADLNRQVLVDGRMRVKLEIDSRDNACRDRHPFAAD